MPEAAYDGHEKGYALSDGYALRRRPDPRIASAIASALAGARTVVNIGAGTGSYEPTDRIVQAVEPSELMIGQRATGAAPCMRGSAESLPFDTGAYDAAVDPMPGVEASPAAMRSGVGLVWRSMLLWMLLLLLLSLAGLFG